MVLTVHVRNDMSGPQVPGLNFLLCMRLVKAILQPMLAEISKNAQPGLWSGLWSNHHQQQLSDDFSD